MDHPNIHTENVLHPEITLKSVLKTEISPISKSVLHELYVQKGLSQRQISTLLASSKTTIQRALTVYGIERRPRGIVPPELRHQSVRYGYRIENGNLVQDPHEQGVLEQIYNHHEQGVSNNKIAQILTSLIIPTKSKKSSWNAETIRQILMRRN